MTKDFAFLVLSCDKYSDLWPSFFKCFRKNFPIDGCPVYLGSNTVVCDEPGVTTILSGEDKDWSSSYKRILQQIPEGKIFVILEDLFAASPVEPQYFFNAIKFLFSSNARYIRYWPGVGFDGPSGAPQILSIDQGAPYRATVCGFWDREYLISLLLEGENPWNFEILGSYRTSYVAGFYGLSQPLFKYRNLVEKGCWIPESVKWASYNGVKLDLEKRPILVGRRHFISRLQMIYFQIMLCVPWRYRVKVMNALRKLIISY